MGQRKGYKQTPEHIARRKRVGEKSWHWLGDKVSEKGGRTRALRLYRDIGVCTICGASKSERHHVDGNTANNEPSNIEVTCRKCHMELDGRLARFTKMAKKNSSLGRMVALEIRKMQTHCKRGHLFSGVNKAGARICKICMKLAKSRYRLKLKNTSTTENIIPTSS